jgi:Major Facilitator Superfamily
MRLLRERHFRNFWLAQSVSLFGGQVAVIALPLTAVLVLDAGPGEMGLLGAAVLLPHLLLSLPAGVWLDRVASRRRVMIATDLWRAALVGTIPLAYALDALTLGQLYAVAFLSGCLAVLFDLSYPTLFVSLTRRGHHLEGNSLTHGSRFFSYVAGGSIMYALTPDRLRARAQGAFNFVNWEIRPVGSLVGGALGAWIGVRPTLWVASLGGLAGVLWLLPSPVPALRELPEEAA